jgi:hypothetical protein
MLAPFSNVSAKTSAPFSNVSAKTSAPFSNVHARTLTILNNLDAVVQRLALVPLCPAFSAASEWGHLGVGKDQLSNFWRLI